MKILAIIGSPRKRNTYQLVQQIEKEMSSYGDIDFSCLFLKDLELHQCRGCFQCIQKGSEFCPIKDDKEMLKNQILKSDGIILATPAYMFTVTALMKNFIDRFAYLGHRPRFFNQHAMIVSTTAGTGLKEVIAYVTNYVAKLWGFRSVTSIGLLTPPYQKNKKLIEKDKMKIKRKAGEFYRRVASLSWSPRFYHMQQFCSLRAIFTIKNMKDAFPADYTLYSSLRNKRFYVDANINSLKYYISFLMAHVIKLAVGGSIKKA